VAPLPHCDQAILDIQKIQNYCLNPAHLRGRHKARLFRRAIGIERGDAGWLRTALLEGIRQNDAVELLGDMFGTRWRVDVPLTRHGKTVVVRTIWIVQSGQHVPRFVTCWVL
jgi:hypothetical protein